MRAIADHLRDREDMVVAMTAVGFTPWQNDVVDLITNRRRLLAPTREELSDHRRSPDVGYRLRLPRRLGS